jgi:hypothetical protein
MAGIKPILDRMARYQESKSLETSATLTNGLPTIGSTAERRIFFVTTDRNQFAGHQLDATNQTAQAGWVVINTGELEQLTVDSHWQDHLPSVFRVMTRKYARQTPFAVYQSPLTLGGESHAEV